MPEQRDRRRLGQRRAAQLGVTVSSDDLSKDVAHLQAKLHQKARTIRALEAKIVRLEKALRSGQTWGQYRRDEEVRAAERHESYVARDGQGRGGD